MLHTLSQSMHFICIGLLFHCAALAAGSKRGRRVVLDLDDSDSEAETRVLLKRRRSMPPADEMENESPAGRRQQESFRAFKL